MKDPFRLVRPCSNCPLRTDRYFHMDHDRAAGIVDAINFGSPFHCHKTIDYSGEHGGEVTAKSQWCAGVLIAAEKSGDTSPLMQIAQRLGFYDPANLEMTAPVHDSLRAWADSYLKGDQP